MRTLKKVLPACLGLAGLISPKVPAQCVFVTSGAAGIFLDSGITWQLHDLDWNNLAQDPFPGEWSTLQVTGKKTTQWFGLPIHLAALTVQKFAPLKIEVPELQLREALSLREGAVEVHPNAKFRLGPALLNEKPELEVHQGWVEGWFGWFWERSDQERRLYPLGAHQSAFLSLKPQIPPDLGGYLDVRFVFEAVPNADHLPLIDSTSSIHRNIVAFLEPGYWERLQETDPLACLGGLWQIRVRHPNQAQESPDQIRLLGWNPQSGWSVFPFGQIEIGDSLPSVMDPTSLSNTDSASLGNNPKIAAGKRDPDLPLHPWLATYDWDCRLNSYCGRLLDWSNAQSLNWESSKDLMHWTLHASSHPPGLDFCFSSDYSDIQRYWRLSLEHPGGLKTILWMGIPPCHPNTLACQPYFAQGRLVVPCTHFRWRLLDVQGRLLVEENAAEIQLSNLPTGWYVWQELGPKYRMLKVFKP